MLTQNEITALNLSPTKKDFVQIWNELLEVAGRLSERWDPTSTNESDPGIVILKALTGIADKLNYNIDKNTLEAFMPTAAQEDSMRKLCDMLGYNIKYYRSAETTVTIRYYNSEPSDDEKNVLENGLFIPKFTVISNGDKDINYFTTNQNPIYISSTTPSVSITCMEGQIVKCNSLANNKVITASQITELNRFYLPESQIAENGIFIYNVGINLEDGTPWERVDNLNIQPRGSRVFKFGYDSYDARPYIEFPVDYSELINDGLFIYYTRTSGANGNVSVRTLTQLELPSGDGWDKVAATSFSAENAFSATSGANIETIGQAYNNFKKTIGTFETLVTCRDYMNKIYTMTNDATGKPYVSNILATDIRSDLNRAVTICSCDDAGIFYKDTPINTALSLGDVTKPKFENGTWQVGSNKIENFINDDQGFDYEKDADVSIDNNGEFWTVTQNNVTYKTGIPAVHNMSAIDHFDLVLYPFKSYTQIKSSVRDIQEVYDASFRYHPKSFNDIKSRLELSDAKTIAHNLVSPRKHDITSINNYLKLNATIGTNAKISTEEGVLLVDKIKIALANAFNMRELDFGEEIPFDSIMEVIVNADPRISVVSLVEPALYTTFSVFEGNDKDGNPMIYEYGVASNWLTDETSDRFEYTNMKNEYTHTFDTVEAKKIYNKLAVRNVLAGRVPLFKYNNTFGASFTDAAYRVTTLRDDKPAGLDEPSETNPITAYTSGDITYVGQLINGTTVYTETAVPPAYKNNIITKAPEATTDLTEIKTTCTLKIDKEDNVFSDITLTEGETVKFRAPNFITEKTFPAYVNYHLRRTTDEQTAAVYATAETLASAINTDDVRDNIIKFFGDQGFKRTFTLAQKVSKETDSTKEDKTVLTIETANPSGINISNILTQSGFIKIANNGAAKVEWAEAGSTGKPGITMPAIELDTGSKFITNDITLSNIMTRVNEVIAKIDPTSFNMPFIISYDFEYVPFDSSTFNYWSDFANTEFNAVKEGANVLWRAYSNSYEAGKYILSGSGAKLLPFTTNTINNLTTNTSYKSILEGVYIAYDLGVDATPTIIRNEEEYQLKDGEYLFIEYTPSSTAEDGTSTPSESVTEIYKSGDIIKPSGFEGSLTSSAYYAQSHSPHKTVKFTVNGASEEIPMFSLGASEQIEIRDFARVVLNKDTLPNTQMIYIYKNFNDCPELEVLTTDNQGDRIDNSYTLKDGEYVFYTDQNKSELAYFSAGTEVTLTGTLVLPRCEIIEIASIFDNGIQDIPWEARSFKTSNGIIFQEFQYITLGANDTLKSLQLSTTDTTTIDENWVPCLDATYQLADSEKDQHLDKISVGSTSTGNGWEVCSLFELSVSQYSLQTLRKTANIETSLSIPWSTTKNEVTGKEEVTYKNITASEGYPLSFKMNLACQSSREKLNLSDVYSNPNKVKSFEVKVFKDDPLAVVQTLPQKLIPFVNGTIVDLANWPVEEYLVPKGSGELWNHIALTRLGTKTDATNTPYDRALRLPVTILPGSYGIFSIYLHYPKNTVISAENTSEEVAWIELPAETRDDDVYIWNVASQTLKHIKDDAGNTLYKKLFLKPGINCIRVNKTIDLFIKTDTENASSDSVLYFDDLRLVDCRSIKTVDDYGNSVEKTTQGINLEQIGYLDTQQSNTFNIFDMNIRKKLKKEYTTNAINQLEARAKEEAAKYLEYETKLNAEQDKLLTVVKLLKNATTELAQAKTLGEDKLKSLIAKYNEICGLLDKKEALQEALDNNASIEEIEKRLVNLFNVLNVEAISKQELIAALDTIETTALEAIANIDAKKISKGIILEDFETAASDDNKTLVSDIKLASLSKISEEYANQLANLFEKLNDVALEAEKNNLKALLNVVNLQKHNSVITQLQAIFNTNEVTINELLSEALALAGGDISNTGTSQREVDYKSLLLVLTNVAALANTATLDTLLAKLSILADKLPDKALYSEISSVITALNEEITGTTSAYNSFKNDLSTLIESVKKKTASTDYDDAIYKATQALATKSQDSYIANLKNQLNTLSTNITALNETYTQTLTKLNTSEDEAVKLVLASLDDYTAKRTTQVNQVKSFSTNIKDAYLSLPYGPRAVTEVWPTYMSGAANKAVLRLYKNIVSAVNGKPSTSVTDGTELGNRQVIKDLIGFNAFQELFNAAKEQSDRNTQNGANRKFIDELSEIISIPTAVTDAFDTIISKDSHKVLYGLITEFTTLISNAAATNVTLSITKKQELLNEIRAELASTISTETQLKDLTAEVLCPSILLADKKLPDDTFYANLKSVLKTDSTALLALTSGFISKLDTLYDKVSGMATAFDNLYKGYTSSAVNTCLSTTNSSILPAGYKANLEGIKTAVTTQELLTKLQNSVLIKILSKDDLTVAWEVTDGDTTKWLSSTGKLLPASFTVEAKRDVDGNWKDANENTINVKNGNSWLILKDKANILPVATSSYETFTIPTANSDIEAILAQLLTNVARLGNVSDVSDSYKDTYDILMLEEQLLTEIRTIDTNRDFYYNVPVESNVAIDFHEADTAANTLMNPASFYDINNINNNFVISKIDIDYLDNGLQIARSSRLS